MSLHTCATTVTVRMLNISIISKTFLSPLLITPSHSWTQTITGQLQSLEISFHSVNGITHGLLCLTYFTQCNDSEILIVAWISVTTDSVLLLNVHVPQIHMYKSQLPMCWRCQEMGPFGGAQVMRILPRSLLVPHKRDSGEIPPPFHHMGHKEKPATWRGAFTQTCWHPGLRLPASGLRNTFLLFRSHPAYGILLLQPNELKSAEDKGLVLFITACTLKFPVSYPPQPPARLELGDCPCQVLPGLWSRPPRLWGCTYVQPLWKTICNFFTDYIHTFPPSGGYPDGWETNECMSL